MSGDFDHYYEATQRLTAENEALRANLILAAAKITALKDLLRDAQENDEGCNNLGIHWHASVKAALKGVE